MPLPEGYTQEEFDRLAPEEKEALGAELDDKGPSVSVDDSQLAAANAEKEAAKAATDEAAKVAADAAAAESAKKTVDSVEDASKSAAVADTSGDTPDPKPAVAVLKADRIVSDEDHKAAKVALGKRFEDGEITTAQFMDEGEDLTRAKLSSDMATKSVAASAEATWQARQDAFFSTPLNAIIRDDPRVWAAMQAQLETMYADQRFKDYTDMQFLNDAGREVRKLFGIEAAPASVDATPAKKPAQAGSVDIPQTLEGKPAAQSNIDTANEFTDIDKLDGMDYEIAVAKMTPDQKARFLAI